MPCCRVSRHLSTLELAARMDQQLAPFYVKSVHNHLATSSRKSFGTDVRTCEKFAKHFSIEPDTVRLQPKEVILPVFDNFAALHNPVRPARTTARTTQSSPTCQHNLVNSLASLYRRRSPSPLPLRLPYLFPLRFPRRLGSSYGSSRSPSVRAALGNSVSSEVRPGKTPSVI